MNTLTKIRLKLKTSSDIQYRKKLRKKQAEELEIKKMAKKVARKKNSEYESKNSTYTYIYKNEDKDIKISYKKDAGLTASMTTTIYYQNETVFRHYGETKTFKPCSWIDTLTKEYKEILEKEKEEREKKLRKKWGLERDCNSKVFNKLYGDDS